MFFIYAIAAFGLMLSTKNTMTHAAAEGARSALSVSDLPTATLQTRQIAQAKATVASSLVSLGSNYRATDTSATVAGCDSAADTNKCITVTIVYPWSTRPLIPQAPGLGLIQPNTLTSTAVVRLG